MSCYNRPVIFKSFIPRCLYRLSIVCIASLPSCLLASETTISSNQKQVYQASFFAQYVPRNALEMIKQLPGFNFDAGSNSRGFGGNAGNVLIDGVRPTSKSGGISAALTRIPADQVERIELLKGNSVEAGGHALVANIISIKSQTSGSWAMRARQTKNTSVKPSIEAVLRTPLKDWETAFDLNIGIEPFYRTAVVEQYDHQNNWLSADKQIYPHHTRFDYFNGEGSTALAEGTLTLNGRLAWDKYQGTIDQAGTEDTAWLLNEQSHEQLGEFGIDWVKTNDDWKLRLLGLTVRQRSQYEYDHSQQGVIAHYQQDGVKTEQVARLTYSHVGKATIKPEFGLEVANNHLNTNAFIGQPGTLELVPGSDVMVKELRGEAFANFAYQPTPALTIEGGLTFESSTIEVTDRADVHASKHLNYIKPRLTANYQLNKQTRLIVEAGRQIGQLSFDHFAANSVAEQNRTNAGNTQLKPDQTDELSASLDWQFNQRGSFKIKAYHQWRSDILEQIIIDTDEQGNIEQGLGNAGDSTRWGLDAHLKLPVDKFIPHGLINFSYYSTYSDFNDPIISGRRNTNSTTPEWFEFLFRQDLAKQQFAWGIEYWGGFSYDDFLVNEIQSTDSNKTLHFFIETTRFFGVKIQLEVSDANTSHIRFNRRFYQNTRAGDYLGSEMAKQQNHPYIILSVFGEF